MSDPIAPTRRIAAPVALIVIAIVIAAAGGMLWSAHRGREALLRADADTILATPALRETALAHGGQVYRDACAPCHGSDGAGNRASGTPDLRDADWLYGAGRVSDIRQITLYGIRSGNSRGWHLAAMPAYATPRPYDAEPLPSLSPAEIDDVVQWLRQREGQPASAPAVSRGARVYQKAGCWDCHGAQGQGDSAVGAPDLRDTITLFGGDEKALTRSVAQGRAGASPAFVRRLDPFSVLAVSVYVASLSQHPSSGAAP